MLDDSNWNESREPSLTKPWFYATHKDKWQSIFTALCIVIDSNWCIICYSEPRVFKKITTISSWEQSSISLLWSAQKLRFSAIMFMDRWSLQLSSPSDMLKKNTTSLDGCYDISLKIFIIFRLLRNYILWSKGCKTSSSTAQIRCRICCPRCRRPPANLRSQFLEAFYAWYNLSYDRRQMKKNNSLLLWR